MNEKYDYVDSYKEIANALLKLKNDKEKFVYIAKKVLCDTSWIETFENRKNNGKFNPINYIDPLTLLAIINGKSKNRYLLLNALCSELNLKITFNKNDKYYGVSIINYNHRILADYRNEEEYQNTSNMLWQIFEDAITFADNNFKNDDLLNKLGIQFDELETNITRSWDRLTHVLSYIRPDSYIALSSPNRNVLKNESLFSADVNNQIKKINLDRIKGRDYFILCKKLTTSKNSIGSLMELSQFAYEEKFKYDYLKSKFNRNEKHNTKIDNEIDIDKLKKHISYKAPTPKQIQKETFGRNQYTRRVALLNSGYKCEYNKNHKSFLSRSTQKNYVETHHIIPMHKQGDPKFHNVNLDVPENVAVLCPICHLALHYGVDADKKMIIKKIYNDRGNSLKEYFKIDDFKELIVFYEKS